VINSFGICFSFIVIKNSDFVFLEAEYADKANMFLSFFESGSHVSSITYASAGLEDTQ